MISHDCSVPVLDGSWLFQVSLAKVVADVRMWLYVSLLFTWMCLTLFLGKVCPNHCLTVLDSFLIASRMSAYPAAYVPATRADHRWHGNVRMRVQATACCEIDVTNIQDEVPYFLWFCLLPNRSTLSSIDASVHRLCDVWVRDCPAGMHSELTELGLDPECCLLLGWPLVNFAVTYRYVGLGVCYRTLKVIHSASHRICETNILYFCAEWSLGQFLFLPSLIPVILIYGTPLHQALDPGDLRVVVNWEYFLLKFCPFSSLFLFFFFFFLGTNERNNNGFWLFCKHPGQLALMSPLPPPPPPTPTPTHSQENQPYANKTECFNEMAGQDA